jgi:hypothetical protein
MSPGVLGRRTVAMAPCRELILHIRNVIGNDLPSRLRIIVTGPTFPCGMHHRRQQGAIRLTLTAHSRVRLADLRNPEASWRICRNPLLSKRAPPSETLWSAGVVCPHHQVVTLSSISSPGGTQPTRPAAGEIKLSAPRPAGAGCKSAPPVVHSGL